MDSLIFLNLIALEIALILFLISWLEEFIDFLRNTLFTIKVSWLIFITSVLWIFHVGSKHYSIMYTKGGEEDEVYVIHFPSLSD